MLVEKVSGKRLDVYLAEILFKPLKMKDTSFQATAEQLRRLADALDADTLKVAFWKSARVEANPGKRYRLGGAGSVFTAEDYFRFAQMMLNKGQLDGDASCRAGPSSFMSDHIAGCMACPSRRRGRAMPPARRAMRCGQAGGTSCTIDAKEKIVGVFLAAGPSTRQHTRFLFKNLLYGGLVD